MGRKLTRLCIDCGERLKNRRLITKRCRPCDIKRRNMMKQGRKTGNCKICNKKLSVKKSTTSLCRSCYLKNPLPAWNKNIKGLAPWNKGKSKFKSREDYRVHLNKNRRNRYHMLTSKEKIADRIRTLIRNSIRHKTCSRKKNSKTVELLGCSIENFIIYIELLFKKNMTWRNYGNGQGKWNIDHIVPISRFDLTIEDEQKKAFNFKNCQPMWSVENFKKSNR